MQQKDWDQDSSRFWSIKFRDQIDPGGDPKHKRAEKQVDGENIHDTPPLWLDLFSFRFDSDKPNLLQNGHFGEVAAFEDTAVNQLSACFSGLL
jgi:hypothetical protein